VNARSLVDRGLRATRLFSLATCLLTACASPAETPPAPADRGSWQTLEDGLELGDFPAPQRARLGDGRIRVLRIDPARFELRLLNASAGNRRPQTARQWCSGDENMVAALNASMYQEDHLTSVSLMRSREHTNNGHLTRHRAVLAFDASVSDAPPVKIIDLECDEFDEWKDRYRAFVQSIRMFSCKGENVWEPQERRWSTAAIGTDSAGHVLFVHVRSPFTAHDLIDFLRELPLDMASLMYAEGGPEAQLYVRAADTEFEFVGSFENAPNEAGNNDRAWPVPNVIGVVRRNPHPG
jgi:hypothetical protein